MAPEESPMGLQIVFKQFLVLGILGGLVSVRAFGEQGSWFLNPSLLYQSSDVSYQPTTSGSGGESEWVKLNIAAGASLGGGLLLGVKYFNEKQSQESTVGSSQTTESVSEVNSLGICFGFKVNELVLMVSVMAIQAPVRTNNISEITLSEGGGTILDFMYLTDLGGWSVGPQFTWRSFNYEKIEDKDDPESNQVQNFSKATETWIEPYLAIMVNF